MTIDSKLLEECTLRLIKNRDNVTFGDLMQCLNRDKVSTHDLSMAIRDLTDNGKIMQESYGKSCLPSRGKHWR